MDNIVLEALIAEWNTRLAGVGIGRIYYYRDAGYFIQLFNTSDGYLNITIDTPLPGLKLLLTRPERPSEINPMLLKMRKEVEGSFIRDITKIPNDRVIIINLGKSRQGVLQKYKLICEFPGKKGNVYLCDDSDKVIALDHPVKTRDRGIEQDDQYSQPPIPSTFTIDNITKENLDEIAARAKKEGINLSQSISSAVMGLGPVLSREIAYRFGNSPGKAFDFIDEIREAINNKDFKPAIYILKDTSNPEVAKRIPYVFNNLTHLNHSKVVEKSSISDVLTEFSIELRQKQGDDSRDRRIDNFLKTEIKKSMRLISNLEDDLEKFKNADQYQKWADLLLANLHSLKKTGDSVRVKDYYSEDQPEIDIPLDPGLSLKANAEKYYRLVKKYKRGERTVSFKLASEKKKIAELKKLHQQTGEPDVNLKDYIPEIQKYGFKPGTGESAKGSKKIKRLPYRLFKSSEGFEILVGKSAADNDDLTFHYAKDNDFWMHAAGSPGSHVVIRNPDKLDECPRKTREEAAMLAAFYSKQRNSSKVQVHSCQKKHVKRIKGAPPGTVRLMGYTGILTAPSIPPGVDKVEDDE